MGRSLRRLLASGCACVALLVVGASAAGAASVQVDLLDFDRQAGGSAVQVTAAVTCAPPELPNTMTYLSVTLYQGKHPHRKYIEGFGGVVDPTQPPIICDNTTHEFSFTVLPTADYADRAFRAGHATALYAVTQCTEVAPNTVHCAPITDEIRARATIRP